MRQYARRFAGTRRQQVMLAPQSHVLATAFENVYFEPESYCRILKDVQRLRGRVYLRDGAIRREHLSPDGRHESPADALSWHMVTLDERGAVVACARFRVHHPAVRFDQLQVSRSSMAQCPEWGWRLRSAVQSDLRKARAMGYRFIEAGGWALDDSVRHTMEAFRIAVGAFAWSELTGGGIGITTATFRNHSASILRKLGGCPMRDGDVELPRYFDPQYDCDMQILRFEAGGYAPRFHNAVLQQTNDLANAALICSAPIAYGTFFPRMSGRALASAS